MCTFYGRKRELQNLRDKNWRAHAQLIVVYGRRRVGKTTLIEEAYRDQTIWKFEGLEAVAERYQIKNFMEQLSHYTLQDELRYKKVKTWQEAFRLLSHCLAGRDIVVFFDEFQWLAEMRNRFVSLFKYYWDNHFSKHSKCRFVICGSVSSFIVEKVLHSKALYGRVDTEIHLEPLPLRDIALFFPQRTATEILDIAMTFGGIPKYLLELNPAWSYLQNLNEGAFSQNGFFFKEFQRLFISHFSKTPHYEKILTTLSNAVCSLDDLAKACDLVKGGPLSSLINDLVLAGFIERDQPVDKQKNSKIIRYRLRDEYLNFYFTFINPNVMEIQNGRFRYHEMASSTLKQWQGYAFERLCRWHAREIADYLRFSGIKYASGSWFRTPVKGKESAQIDLLFDRQDKVLTACEIKYVARLAGKKIITDFKRKVEVLQDHYPSHSIQKVLIVADKTTLPSELSGYFDEVVRATEVFF